MVAGLAVCQSEMRASCLCFFAASPALRNSVSMRRVFPGERGFLLRPVGSGMGPAMQWSWRGGRGFHAGGWYSVLGC